MYGQRKVSKRKHTLATRPLHILASARDLADIQITPSGLGLHWPKLAADLYLPALLDGLLGSKKWLAAKLGAAGGRARSQAKAASARENGKRGWRPRKAAAS